MRCTNCKLYQYSPVQVQPDVVKKDENDSPKLYFIAMHPYPDDALDGKAYHSSNMGKFFKTCMDGMGINSYRIFTVVRCVPFDTQYLENPEKQFSIPPTVNHRNPYPDEIKACQHYILRNIVATNPNVLVPMGKEAFHWIMQDSSIDFKKEIGHIFYKTIADKEFMVVPINDPTPIFSQVRSGDIKDNEYTSNFYRDVEKCAKLADGTWVDVMKANEVAYATDYVSFKNYYLEVLQDKEELAYDIETNAALVFEKKFDIIGFSLAAKRKGIYVCMKALDKRMSLEDIIRCKTLLRAILRKTPKVIVHNCLYERPATLYNIGYDFPFEQLDDTLVMAKLMLGGKVGAGLKPNAQRIGYPDWETDLTLYINLIDTFHSGSSMVKYSSMVVALRNGMTVSDYFRKVEDYHNFLEKELLGMVEKLNDIDSNFVLFDFVSDKKVLKTLSSYSSEDFDFKKFQWFAKAYASLHKKFAPSGNVSIMPLLNASKAMEELLLKYYDKKELPHLMTLISQKIIEYIDNGIFGDVIPYDWIPWKMLSKYGATDSLATIDLKDYYLERFEKESTDEVKLEKGYHYALMEHYVGHCLMMAGIKWNDKAAQWDRENYVKVLSLTLRFLFTSPKVMDFIVSSKWLDHAPKVIYEKFNDWMWENYHQRVSLTHDSNGVEVLKTVYLDEKGEEKTKHIKHLFFISEDNPINLPEDFIKNIKKEVKEIIQDEISKIEDTDWESLKEYFNPSAQDSELVSVVSDVLVSEDVRLGRFIHHLEAIYTREDFNFASKIGIRGYLKPYDAYMRTKFAELFPEIKGSLMEKEAKYKEFVKIHKKASGDLSQEYFLNNIVLDCPVWKLLNDYESAKDKDEKKKAYEELRLVYRKCSEKYDFLMTENLKFKEYERKEIKIFSQDDVQEAFLKAKNYALEGLKDEDQIDVYDALRMNPSMNPDDEKTWSYEMRWLFNYRCFKKAFKMVGTYIDGSSGRDNVYIVDHETLSEGNDVVPRLEKYKEYVEEGKTFDGKDFLEQVKFGVGTAETGRWRSGIHTLPASSTLKKLYSSRFRGGTILMPDFSANEMRCVASYAQEDAMLKAFAEGMDIHRANAATIYGIPYDEVTSPQRKSAKALSFGVLYGSSVYSIADMYFNGNVSKAQDVLDQFFKAFPKLKSWIEAKHKEGMETHKVSVLTHRFLTIDFDPSDKGSVSAAMRKCQNFPIQSTNKHTRLIGIDGETYEIGDLADQNKSIWVYSYDIENQRVVPVKTFPAQCTGTTDAWVELVLDNNEKIKVTPDHLMMLRDGTYRRADELKVNDSLMPFYCTSDGYVNFNKGIKNSQPFYQIVHDYIYPYVNKEIYSQIHHINMNHSDNRPENLVRLSAKNHITYHRRLRQCCFDLSGFKELEQFMEKIIFETYDKPDAEVLMKNVRDFHKSLDLDDMDILAEKSMSARNKNRKFDYPDWYENQREAVSKETHKRLEETGNVLGVGKQEYSDLMKQSWSKNHDYRKKRLKEGHTSESAIQHHVGASVLREADPEYKFNRVKRQIAYFYKNNLSYETPELWDISSKEYDIPTNKRKSEYILSAMSWDEFLKKAKGFLNSSDLDFVLLRQDEKPAQDKKKETAFDQARPAIELFRQKNLDWNTPYEWDMNGKLLFEKILPSKKILQYFEWDEFKKRSEDYLIGYNHQIKEINIIHLDEPEPKYDIHVPLFQNFALSAGVFTHNSAASSVAAIVFCDIILFMRKHNLKSKPICFIHDSLESDVYPYELFRVLEHQQAELSQSAMRMFNLALKADIAMGVNMGSECEMKKLEILDEEKTKGFITLEGEEADIMDLVENWKTAFYRVEVQEEEFKDKKNPMSLLFMKKKSFDPSIHSHSREGKAKIYIQYYNENGEIEPMNTGEPKLHDIWADVPLFDYMGMKDGIEIPKE